LSRQRILSNLLTMGIGQVATFVFTLLLFVVVSRYLGPTRFGELTLAKAIVMVAWLGVTLGMETLITRTVAREPERSGRVASAGMIARGALAGPMLGAIFVYAHLAHLNTETTLAAYVYGVAQAIWALERVLLSVFQGRERMSLSAQWSIVRNVLALLLVLIVRWRHGGVVAFAATQIPVEIVLFAVTLHWMRDVARLTWRVSWRELREVTQGSLAFWANEVFFTIYLYVDAVILAALGGALAVGIYTPATQMLSSTMFLTVIIGSATLPQLSRLGVEQGPDFRRAGRRTLSLFVVAAVPITIGAITLSGPVILTVFGPAYRPSLPVAVAISLAILPMFLNFQFSQILAACDRQWLWTLALAGCCLLNPPLNFVLIPLAQHMAHNPALGAAIAWVVTEVVEVIYGIIILRSVVFDRTMRRVLAGAILAGAAQAAVLWLTRGLWPLVGEALAALTYGGVAVALGAVPRNDIVLVATTLRGRIAPSSGRAPLAAAAQRADGAGRDVPVASNNDETLVVNRGGQAPSNRPSSAGMAARGEIVPLTRPSITGLRQERGHQPGTITFFGTCAPQCTVLLLDGSSFVASATSDDAGSWSVRMHGMDAGSHIFRVNAIDARGRTSASSNPWGVALMPSRSAQDASEVLEAVTGQAAPQSVEESFPGQATPPVRKWETSRGINPRLVRAVDPLQGQDGRT